MGPAGAGSLATVINAAIAGKDRMASMKSFFEGVGEGHSAGVHEDIPVDRPDFKARYAARRLAAVKAEQAVGS
jgi:chlorophyllide a reductase subunit Y